MKQDTRLDSRIAEVHNGSSLFTGDAGQGESNIRRWIIENDWLEAIVARPLSIRAFSKLVMRLAYREYRFKRGSRTIS
jgi:type I restriction-modification system DNA methylase subunit